MRWFAAVLATTACNQVFGLRETEQRPPEDAQYFDAPGDAPFTCPPIGTAPRYSTLLHQVSAQHCYGYSANERAGRAAAMCRGADGFHRVFEGEIGQPLEPTTGPEALDSTGLVDLPHLTPDGAHLFLRYTDYGTTLTKIVSFARAGGGAWTPEPDLPFGNQNNLTYSSVVDGPGGYRVLVRLSDTAFHEWEHDATGWHELRVHTEPAAGLTGASPSSLTSDGLRMLFYGNNPIGEVFYTDRPDLDSLFGPRVAIEGVPGEAPDAALTDDCARVNFTGLGYLFYVQQL